MNISEIYLLTAFVCSACDGDIAPQEISLLRDWTAKCNLFGDIDVESTINQYVDSINQDGGEFLNDYFHLLKDSVLTLEEQLQIVKIAIEMIEADGLILYSEAKFFKKLRSCLSISDEAILDVLPDKEDYLLPDIRTTEFVFDDNIKFEGINLNANI